MALKYFGSIWFNQCNPVTCITAYRVEFWWCPPFKQEGVSAVKLAIFSLVKMISS